MGRRGHDLYFVMTGLDPAIQLVVLGRINAVFNISSAFQFLRTFPVENLRQHPQLSALFVRFLPADISGKRRYGVVVDFRSGAGFHAADELREIVC